tara:strand:+ start:463 stop:912 length:450 start_codon:yes stop_codon:yes gene_type:complete
MGFTTGGGEIEKTAEQKAIERRQRMALDKETAQSERRLKAVARGKLGKASLLGTPEEEDAFAGRKPKTIFDVAGGDDKPLEAYRGKGEAITQGYGITTTGEFAKRTEPGPGSRGKMHADQADREKFGSNNTNSDSGKGTRGRSKKGKKV